jgi:porin
MYLLQLRISISTRLQIFFAAIFIAVMSTGSAPAQTPAANFGGDLWSRSKLTGDWGDSRSRLAENGVTLDLSLLSIPQGVVSGGRDTTFRWGGTSELVLKLDSQKLGLWPGGFFLARADVAFKHDVNGNTGALMPVNTDIVLPLPARDEIVLSHIIFTQFLSEWFGLG